MKTNWILLLLTLGFAMNANASWWDDLFGSDDEAAVEEATSSAGDSKKAMLEAAGTATTTGLGLLPTVTQQLGVTEAQARGGLGALFQASKSVLSEDDFATLSGAVPEMDSLLSAAPPTNELLGSAMSMVGGEGTASAAADLLGQFDSLGLSPDMVSKFGNVAAGYLKGESPAASEQLMSAVSSLLQ